MNEVKRSLIEVAGDMNESKDRVRSRLNKHHNKRNDFKKNLFAAFGAVAMIFVLFFSVTLLLNQQTKNSQITQSNSELFNDQVFEMTINIRKVWDDSSDDDYYKKVAYEQYEKKLAIYTYALSLGYEITDKEVEQNFNRMIELMTSTEEIKNYYEELLAKINVTWEEFESYELKNAPLNVAHEKLQEHYMKMYPKIEADIASSLAVKHAVPYFREHFSNDILAYKEKHNLPLYDSRTSTGSKYLGRVVAVEDNMILVSPTATIEDIEMLTKQELTQKYFEETWYPLDTPTAISVGDIIEAHSKLHTSTDTIPSVSDLLDLRMIDDYEPGLEHNETIHLTIDKGNSSGVKTFVWMLNWEKANLEFTRSAAYQFVVNDVTYEIWSYPDGFVLYSSRGEYRKLNEDFTVELAGYLGISSGIN